MNLLAILLISTLTYPGSNGCNSVQTESGECCYFPFMYNGQTYYECTTDGRFPQQWCSLTYNYDQDGQWGNCGNCTTVQTEEGGCCYFPFVYNGQTYHQCTSVNWTQPWCSLTVNFNQDGQRGNCTDNPTTTTTPSPLPTTPDNPTTSTTTPPPPTTPDNLTTPTPTATTPTLTPTTSGFSCGSRPDGTRIVGGTQAQKDSWPWQALLAMAGGSQFCGGSLIEAQWVVTTAHCAYGLSPSDFVVRMGANKRTDIGQELKVDQIIMHEDYDPDTLDNDIALLKLKTRVTFGTGVGLVCLPDPRFPSFSGKACYITGWGATSEGGSQPMYLQEALVKTFSTADCIKFYPGQITDSMLCAGSIEGEVDACQGDSGGPLVCEFDGRWYLEGATSWGNGCARPELPGVYADAHYFADWIDNVRSSN